MFYPEERLAFPLIPQFMVALRSWLWILLVVVAGATQDPIAQAAPGPGAEGLGSARGCMRSRTGGVGTVAPDAGIPAALVEAVRPRV